MCRWTVLVLCVVAALLAGCSESTDDDEAGVGTLPNDDPAIGDDPQTATAPLLTFDTQERVLEEVFGIYSGEAWDTTPLSLPRALSGVEGVFEPTDSLTEQPDGRFALVLVAS